ncbi:MAG: beta-propeller domain-containing protein [bacterium]
MNKHVSRLLPLFCCSLLILFPFNFGFAAESLPKVKNCADLESRITSSSGYSTKAISVPGNQTNVSTDTSEKSGMGFSSTNVQVEGVDEGDIVKTDGEYIYIVKTDANSIAQNASIRVLRTFSDGTFKEIARLQTGDNSFRPREVYVDGDRLVVIGETSLPDKQFRGFLQGSKLYIYDVSNKDAIKELRHVAFDTSLLSSRKIGDVVYAVLYRAPRYWIMEKRLANGGASSSEDTVANDFFPVVFDSIAGDVRQPLLPCEDISYIPDFSEPSYMVVASVNVRTATDELTKQVTLGTGQNIYASQNNLYVAATNFRGDIMPLLMKQSDSNSSGVSAPTPGATIDPVPPLTPDDPKNTIIRPQEETTNLYKFSISDGTVKFLNHQEVPGHILNQFSMDEFDGYFRVATTKQTFVADGAVTNNVYVLDPSFQLVGKLEGLAKGEQLRSARFLGKRAYLVTFKNIDPLFVIDLSTPQKPTVLGELKIPGYSDYLEPYDETHLIGFGKDAIDAKIEDTFWRSVDFAWYQGLKVALFDVSDPSHPVEQFHEIIGDRGTDSPVLRDHHALLFDKEKNLLAFPVDVAEIKNKQGQKLNGSEYGEVVFRGAYVYSLSLDKGFTLRGKLSHVKGAISSNLPDVISNDGKGMQCDASQCYFSDAIMRLLWIDSSLYTVAPGSVRAWNLETLVPIGDLFSLEDEGSPKQTMRYDYSNKIDFASGYKATWVSQTLPKDTTFSTNGDEYFDVKPGDSVVVNAVFRNDGQFTWYKDTPDRQMAVSVYKDTAVQSAPKALGFDDPKNKNFGKSYFHSSSWLSDFRIGTMVEDVVVPGKTGTFTLTFTIPQDAPVGRFREDITVSSGPFWLLNEANGDPLQAAHIWVGFEVRK